MPKLCNEGERWFLEKTLAQNTLYMGLYLDSPEPDEDATLATITECSGAGYSRIAVDPSEWSIVTDSDGNTVGTAQQHTWTAEGDWQPVYGYFITDAASGTDGNLIFVADFEYGPYTLHDGFTLSVTPKVQMS